MKILEKGSRCSNKFTVLYYMNKMRRLLYMYDVEVESDRKMKTKDEKEK